MDKFKIFFIILISFLALAIGGFLLSRYLQVMGEIIFYILGVLWLLTVSGLIGPKNLKNKIREFQVWFRTKTVLFFPIHPYKPIDEALKGGVREFLPTKERVKNFLTYRLLFRAVSFILAIIVIAGFFAWQYFMAPEEPSAESVSWQIYKNAKYDIEFRYPNSWTLEDKEALSVDLPDQARNFVQVNISNGVSGRKDESMSFCQPGVASVVYQTGKLRDSQQSFEEFVNFQIENPERGMPPVVKPILISTMVGGHDGLKIEGVIDNCITEFYYVEQGLDRYMTISFIVDKNDDKIIIEKILSTFKFIEAKFRTTEEQYIKFASPAGLAEEGNSYIIRWEQKGLERWGNKITICLIGFDVYGKTISAKKNWKSPTCAYAMSSEGLASYLIDKTTLTAESYNWIIPENVSERFETRPYNFKISLLVLDELPPEGRTEWAGLIAQDESDAYFNIQSMTSK